MAEEQAQGFEKDILKEAVLASVTEHRRSRRWGIFFKLMILAYVVFVTAVYFMQSDGKPMVHKGKDHVALIDLNGEIGVDKEIEADNVAAALRDAFKEEHAKAVLLRINSPGGSPVQSAYIYDEIKRLHEQKPDIKVYAVIMDIGASGGYFIASAADEIYANKSSLVGSIGVLLPNFGFVGTMDKLGVEQRALTAGENKMLLDPFSAKNPKHIEFAQSVIDNVHGHFIEAVKNGRGDRLAKNKDIFSGLFWSGEQAKALGIIDGFGSAGSVARDVIGIEEIIDYTVRPNFFDILGMQMGAKFDKALNALSGGAYRSKQHPELY